MSKVLKTFGSLVFHQDMIKSKVSKPVYQAYVNALELGIPLSNRVVHDIAEAAKKWAMGLGATHYTHWFQPQRSGTAEKHDSFLNVDGKGGYFESFSGSQLIQSEPDASSFPFGGIRSTFEARGYTIWDPTSPMYIRDCDGNKSLVIPSIYLSWTGEALGLKMPLLRSVKALNTAAIRLQTLLGNTKVKQIKVFSGLEQEYFLIPMDVYHQRPDLELCGRTLFGKAPVKGQVMNDHYFGAFSSQIIEFMSDLDDTLYAHGIPAKTKHNEVAPNQFELAPLHEEISVAIDHNIQMMDIMNRVGKRHNLKVLLHEKPFDGINGSGKHMNWSVGDTTGVNYLSPSDSPEKNNIFLLTLGALLIGTHKYAGLLQSTILDAGNEHRMGSHEAPPAILSVYLGEHLDSILNSIETETAFKPQKVTEIQHGLASLPSAMKDISDRNRTSPIAYTGHKFEIRALGSSCNPSNAAKVMNMICAYGYNVLSDALESKKGALSKRVFSVLKKELKRSKAIRFEGDNYSDAWKKEAKKRGLFLTKSTPEASDANLSKEGLALVISLDVYSKKEVVSRVEILNENYMNTKVVEFKLAVDLTKRSILPSILWQMNDMGKVLVQGKQLNMNASSIQKDFKVLEALYSSIQTKANYLEKWVGQLEDSDKSLSQKAKLTATKGVDQLQSLRDDVDRAETLVSEAYWPLLSYDQILLPY